MNLDIMIPTTKKIINRSFYSQKNANADLIFENFAYGYKFRISTKNTSKNRHRILPPIKFVRIQKCQKQFGICFYCKGGIHIGQWLMK